MIQLALVTNHLPSVADANLHGPPLILAKLDSAALIRDQRTRLTHPPATWQH
jgi:hypothetical protein